MKADRSHQKLVSIKNRSVKEKMGSKFSTKEVLDNNKSIFQFVNHFLKKILKDSPTRYECK